MAELETYEMGQDSATLVKSTDPKWLLAIGIMMAIVGLIALFSAVATTFFSVLLIGSVLIVSAIAQITYAFKSRGWRGFLYHLAVAVLYGIAGFAIVMSPVEGAAMITLVLAATMIGSGLLRLFTAFSGRFKNWGWAAVSGLVSIGLAAYILSYWPVSSLVVLGVIVGVDLFFLGIYLTVLGASLRTTLGTSIGLTPNLAENSLDASAAVSHS